MIAPVINRIDSKHEIVIFKELFVLSVNNKTRKLCNRNNKMTDFLYAAKWKNSCRKRISKLDRSHSLNLIIRIVHTTGNPSRFPVVALDKLLQKSYPIVSNQITEADASTRFQNDVGTSAFCVSRRPRLFITSATWSMKLHF